MATVQVTEKTFEATVKQVIVLLDFWAAWCGPCRAFAPVLEAAATRHPDVVFGKVDTEDEPGLAAAFSGSSHPDLVAKPKRYSARRPSRVAIPGGRPRRVVNKVRALDMNEVRRSFNEQEDRRPAPRVTTAGGV